MFDNAHGLLSNTVAGAQRNALLKRTSQDPAPNCPGGGAGYTVTTAQALLTVTNDKSFNHSDGFCYRSCGFPHLWNASPEGEECEKTARPLVLFDYRWVLPGWVRAQRGGGGETCCGLRSRRPDMHGTTRDRAVLVNVCEACWGMLHA